MSVAIYKQAFESEVLDPKEHGRLVKEIESVAKRAGIPIQMVWTSMTKFCTEDEISYVRELRKKMNKGVLGLVYVGSAEAYKAIIDRMSAVAAACVRIYINAMVMNVNDVTIMIFRSGAQGRYLICCTRESRKDCKLSFTSAV